MSCIYLGILSKRCLLSYLSHFEKIFPDDISKFDSTKTFFFSILLFIIIIIVELTVYF